MTAVYNGPAGQVVVSQAATFGKVRYSPHIMQTRTHEAGGEHRFRVVDAGRRTGKSVIGGHELTHAALIAQAMKASLEPKGLRHEYWIVGPEYSDAEKEFRVLYNDLVHLQAPFDKPGTYYDAVGGNMHISLFEGRFQVHAKSAKYPQTLVGEGLKGVILAEAAKLKESVWTKYIRPTLADYRGWALMTSTPEGKNWFYRAWMNGQNPQNKEWWSIKAPSWTNEIVFPDGRQDSEILEMEASMSTEKFKQEIGAEFTEFVGGVFKDYDEETVVGNAPYNPRWPLVIATDYGFTNPNVALFIQWDVWDNVWVCAEYYRRNRTATEFAEDVKNDPMLGPLSRAATMLFPDPAGPEASATLAEHWQVGISGHTGGLLSTRLDLIRRWLRPQPLELEDGHPDKKPRLKIDFSCTNMIREMGDYRYPETRDEAGRNAIENPLSKDDHTPEALGRFMMAKYGDIVPEETRARVSKARVARPR